VVPKLPNKEVYCDIHPDSLLFCPACNGGKGGTTTAHKYTHEQLARWGSKGGRPKKKKRRAKPKPAQ
jgi:hypothetical protein